MKNDYKLLQTTVESLQVKFDSILSSQQNETFENDQSPPPSGQEIPSIETENSITNNPSSVAKRIITVKENVTSAQSMNNSAAMTAPGGKVISNIIVNTQALDRNWEEFIMGSSHQGKSVQRS